MSDRASAGSTAVRSRPPLPTARGWCVGAAGVLLLAAAIVLRRSDLLFVALVPLLAPAAAMLALALDRPWLSVSRSYTPETVAAGEEAVVHLRVRNQSERPLPAMPWRDRRPAGVSGPGRQLLPSLARRVIGGGDGADSASLRYAVRPTRRGAHLLGPLLLQWRDPFGLASTEYAVGAARPLLATPIVADLARSRLDLASSEGSERELLTPKAPTADEVVARAYRPGDPLRRVHWRATAKRDELMVRQEGQRSNPQTWILLDTLQTQGGPLGLGLGARREPFERAVELVASVAVHALQGGYVVGVVETGAAQLNGRAASVSTGGGAAAFELPAGDTQLLGQLAGLEQQQAATADAESAVGAFSAALRRTGAVSPAFLVLADGPAEAWPAFAGIRAQCDPAVAFLASEQARAAEPQLSAAGWVCVPVNAGTSPAEAWQQASAGYARRASEETADAR